MAISSVCRFGLLAALLGVTGLAPAQAQSPTTGAISGVVHDATGGAVADALVTLSGDRSASRTARTDGVGEFRFAFVPTGDHRLSVEKDGHVPLLSTLLLHAGAEVRVELALASNSNRTEAIQQISTATTFRGHSVGELVPLPDLARELPLGPRAELSELARLIPTLDESLGAEGLPGTLSSILIDGTPFRPATHPLALRGTFHSTAFSLESFRAADVVLNGLDVQWPSAAGALLGAQSWTSTPDNRGGARLRWSGDVLPGASSLGGEVSSFNNAQLGFRLGGQLGATARLALGGQASLEQAPLARAWPSTNAALSLAAAAAEAGVDLDDPTRAQTRQADAISLFGRLDWQPAPRDRLEVSAHVASLPRVVVPTGAVAARSGGPMVEGFDLVASAALHSIVSDRTANLARVGVTYSERHTGDTDAVAPTFLVLEGLGFGSGARAADGREAFVHLRNTLQRHAGAHTLSVGASLTLGSYRYQDQGLAGGVFFFGSTDLLRARQGVMLRTEGPAQVSDWSAPSGGLYVQDQWHVRPGFDLLVGALVERRALPGDGVERDREWFRLTEIANDLVDSPPWRVSPRVGATWDVLGDGRWTLDLAAGTYYDQPDPLLLAQWRSDAGAIRLRRQIGDVAWPAPGGGGAPRRTLTVLAPDFDAPFTARITAGLVRQLNAATVVDVHLVSRRTKSLPTRHDLNLLSLPTAHDQYGRPVYGTLLKQAALLAALPGSGRRFDGFDEVTGLAADGWSEHKGVTVGVEHEVGSSISLAARYHFGRTRDNWFGGSWTAQAPAGFEGEEWLAGRSDFDVPHRLVASAEVQPTAGLRLAAFYRYASGEPFTPGFRTGVDANGDGAFGNDPAFVDEGLPGMAALMDRWPCLRSASGEFASRNVCRAQDSHNGDLRVDWTAPRFLPATTSLVLEVFNLFATERALPDDALYLIDPAANLVLDTSSRTVSLPLVVNPGFGEPLPNRQPGRLLRLGLSLNW